MANRSDITPELCRQLLRYEPETGRLFWKRRPREMFPTDQSWKAWNTRFAEKEALTARSRGYRVGAIDYVMVKAHRVAWAIHHGEWPIVIDHINGDPADNRISNLRNISQAENLKNLGIRSDNKTGFSGIGFANGRWTAEIKVSGVKHWLGSFVDRDEAVFARREAEVKFGFHSNHCRR